MTAEETQHIPFMTEIHRRSEMVLRSRLESFSKDQLTLFSSPTTFICTPLQGTYHILWHSTYHVEFLEVELLRKYDILLNQSQL